MGFAFHRRVFGRHPERVPSHRVEDIKPLRPLVARKHVAHRIVADMPHMDAPGRVREHLQYVAFRPAGLGFCGKNVVLRPNPLPVAFPLLRIVSFGGHGTSGNHVWGFWDFVLY